jgi:hypothetical protein
MLAFSRRTCAEADPSSPACPNIGEVIAFPRNRQAQDLMMGAPSPVPPERLRELHVRVVLPDRDRAPEPRSRGAGEKKLPTDSIVT